MSRTRRTRTWVWPVVAVALAVNVAGTFAIAGSGSVRAGLTHAEKLVTWDTTTGPTPGPTPAASPTPATPSPATTFLSELGALAPRALLGSQMSTLTPSPTGTTTVAPCWTAPATAASTTWVSSGDGGGATVQILVTATGAGTATVDKWRTDAQACSSTQLTTSSADLHPASAPAGFTVAVTPVTHTAAPRLTQVVWSRGDVVILLTYATGREGATGVSWADFGHVREVVATLDTQVVSHLSPVCPDLTPTAADATRNPALPGYTPYARTQTITIPAAPDVPQPPAPAPAPAEQLPPAAPVASLAPVSPLTAAQLIDTNGDGRPDSALDVTQAPRDPAPVLVDPTAFAAPSVVATDPGPAPKRPSGAPDHLDYPVRAPDLTGPGCGWAFTGASPPAYDPAQDAAQDAEVRADTLARAAQVHLSAWTAQLAWAQQWSTWATREAAYSPVSAYERARQDAVNAYQGAVATYQASVQAYTDAAKAATLPPQNDPTPSPTDPTPTVTPTPAGSTP